MSPSPSAGQSPATARPAYAERLDLPWWLWLAGLVAAALLAVEIWMGAPGVRAWLPFAVLLPATAAGLWWLGRIRVAVVDAELRVDDARLPVRFVADVVPLDAAGRREVLGVGADPLAFVVQRPWIGGAVQVVLDDPADPTPFWVVSTRRPVELAEAVLAARDALRLADRSAGEPS
ncbi:DUF3093 domain-containing protein [Micromonospora sp. NPDC093244]|uniref:DUF3093 domain-containing protein n=1 Tax=Micromonospora sp. NPDC093244 TaxID=3155071 RepID=UPI0034442261